jgi:glucose/arabinose dehydrogenase
MKKVPGRTLHAPQISRRHRGLHRLRHHACCRAAADGLKLPPGFHAQVVAEGVGTNLRHLAMRDDHTIYASTRGGGGGRGGAPAANPGILVLHLDANHKLDKTDHFSQVSGGTGIRIQGNWLYAASVTDVYRIALKPGEAVPSAAPEVVVTGMPAAAFNNRMLALDGKGNLFVSVGGTGNICTGPAGRGQQPKGLHPCPGVTDRGGVWKFSANKLNQKFPGDGVQIATGLRDTDAMDVRPGDAVYLYMHDRSSTHDTWPNLVSEQDEENLSEEFHRLPVNAKEPVNMGWPYTYYDSVRKQRLMAPEYGGDGKLSPPPGIYATPIVTLHPSHGAPLDLVFYNGRQFPPCLSRRRLCRAPWRPGAGASRGPQRL